MKIRRSRYLKHNEYSQYNLRSQRLKTKPEKRDSSRDTLVSLAIGVSCRVIPMDTFFLTGLPPL